ncbi:phage tail tape measure protein [Streptomyces sp. NBC_01016]|uniref:phage tail tape measure protein n=1 Tax=Streptomyces sp. NBC_01016 TaxID=2903720 RepID=UPI002253CB2C|nr:phage tail tape measure protein [Streptomyces sp. NBC_01016]MCX4827190.1 phage tail tape measure protein [Streptomyces sp. NBC_01016]
MALNVGELAGTITLDASGVADGLRDAERQMQRAGDRMGADAGRAGQSAGQQLGDGITHGATNGTRDLSRHMTAAGRQAGEGLGEGVRSSSSSVGEAAGSVGDSGGDSFMQRMRGRASAGVSDVATSVRSGLSAKLGLAAIGAAAGALLMQGMQTALDQSRITGRLGAQLGATGPEMKKYGHIAGRMYADAVTEDFQGAADAISAVMRAGIAPPGATEAQLQSLATKVSDLANTFELDLGQTANAVGQMIKTGLAKNGTEAVDALTRGLQKMGPRADDIADTFNEYSTIFRQMGLSATDATGLLSQGMKAGARDTDVVADALKEFTLITQTGGSKVDDAFKKIGLSGKEMQAAFVKGGPTARAALDKVFEGLSKMKDGTDKNNVALTLFGTKSEDTQKALMALDPSSAASALGKVGGAADRMGDSLRDNAGTRLEAFKRGIQQNVVDFLGGQVLPAFQKVKTFVVQQFGGMWAEAGQNGATGLDQFFAFLPLLGEKLVTKIKELAPKAVAGLQQLGTDMANWMMENPDKMFKIALFAQAIIVGMSLLPMLVLAAVVAAAGMIIGSLGQRLLEGAGEKLSQLGTWISTWFGGLWSRYVATPASTFLANFTMWVASLPGRAGRALSNLGSTIALVASRSWQMFKDAAARKGTEFLVWAAGLPGRISRAIGSLKDLLVSKGADVVRGLLAGVESMGSWLRSRLMSFAKGMIPGPIAKALGIHSPSKVMASQVGRWIPAGIAQGVEANTGVLDRTMSSLVDTPTPSAAMASSVGGAVAGASGGGGSSAITLRVDTGGSAADELLANLIRQFVKVRGGNVQTVLGRG